MADNTVPYWGSFAGQQFDYDPSQTAAGRQFLDAVRKYDPNAQFVAHSRGGEGGSGQSFYQLSIDNSKAPWNQGQVDLNANAYDPLYNGPMDSGYSTGHGFNTSQLYDPNATRSDPRLGTVTDSKNVKPDSGTWLDKFGPLAVGGFGLLMGGMPALYQGVFGQGPYGAADLSGLGSADPFLNGGTGAMDMTGSYGTGLPGSIGANAPMGSAESSLYGTIAQTDPVAAFGGGSPGISGELLPMMPQDPASLYNPMLPFNPADPTLALGGSALGNFGRALGSAASSLGKGIIGSPQATGGATGGGGGGMLSLGGGGPTAEDAASILQRFYGPRHRHGLLGM